jgi:toxin CptA
MMSNLLGDKPLSHYNVKPIQLNLKPSYWLAALFAASSLGASIIVLCMPMLVSLKIFICVPIALSAAYFIAQDALILLPWSFTSLALDNKGELSVTRRDGLVGLASVLPSSFVAAYLTVLNMRINSSRWRRNLILSPDRVDAEAFRRLRVWLLWGDFERNQNKTSAVSGDSALG